MKLQLDQAEIETAVRDYVANQGIKIEGKTTTVKFSMTRGEAGLVADLTIDEAPVQAQTKVTTRTPRANTVGAAIESQPAKAGAPVNKLPTTAAEALAQAKADADKAKEGGEESPAATAEEAGTEEVVVEEQTAAVVEAEPVKTTTSLFG